MRVIVVEENGLAQSDATPLLAEQDFGHASTNFSLRWRGRVGRVHPVDGPNRGDDDE
jgi:hypothetical protein